jgi:hypothetical protein
MERCVKFFNDVRVHFLVARSVTQGAMEASWADNRGQSPLHRKWQLGYRIAAGDASRSSIFVDTCKLWKSTIWPAARHIVEAHQHQQDGFIKAQSRARCLDQRSGDLSLLAKRYSRSS